MSEQVCWSCGNPAGGKRGELDNFGGTLIHRYAECREIAGIEEDGPESLIWPKGATVVPNNPAGEMPFLLLSGESAREFIRAEVRRALDELAEEMRKHSAFQPTRRV